MALPSFCGTPSNPLEKKKKCITYINYFSIINMHLFLWDRKKSSKFLSNRHHVYILHVAISKGLLFNGIMITWRINWIHPVRTTFAAYPIYVFLFFCTNPAHLGLAAFASVGKWPLVISVLNFIFCRLQKKSSNILLCMPACTYMHPLLVYYISSIAVLCLELIF